MVANLVGKCVRHGDDPSVGQGRQKIVQVPLFDVLHDLAAVHQVDREDEWSRSEIMQEDRSYRPVDIRLQPVKTNGLHTGIRKVFDAVSFTAPDIQNAVDQKTFQEKGPQCGMVRIRIPSDDVSAERGNIRIYSDFLWRFPV